MSKARKRLVFIDKTRSHHACPACMDRDALSATGKARYNRGSRLTGGCELCGGRGVVTAGWTRFDKHYDPWVVKKVAA